MYLKFRTHLVNCQGYAGGGAALPVVFCLGHLHDLLITQLEGLAEGQAHCLLINGLAPLYCREVPLFWRM